MPAPHAQAQAATSSADAAAQLPPIRPLYAVLLVVGSLTALVILIFWIVIAKMLPPTSSPLIEWMRNDEYYCFLVPLAIMPTSFLYRFLSWLSYQHFKMS